MENLVSLRQLQEFYGGKKVFITGHTGFKGSWLMACLHLAGAQIKGYALPPDYDNGLFDVLGPLRMEESCIADIRNKERLRDELAAFAPDYVFHLAAQPLVRRSYEIPADTFDTNVTGTANLLEAIVKLDQSCTVIIITTDKVYHNREEDILYDEEDALGGYDPYSASKACAELVVNSFRSSFFNTALVNGAVKPGGPVKALASVRAGNVIGGGDWSVDRIIPDIARALLQNQTIPVRNPRSVRPWQHVLEPIAGYLLLGGRLHKHPDKYAKAYNFGPLPGDHLEVKELVETAIAVWGSGTWKDTSTPGAPHEAGLLKLSIARAMAELNWTPRLNAREAVQWSLEWYRQPLEQQAAFTISQIKSYFAL